MEQLTTGTAKMFLARTAASREDPKKYVDSYRTMCVLPLVFFWSVFIFSYQRIEFLQLHGFKQEETNQSKQAKKKKKPKTTKKEGEVVVVWQQQNPPNIKKQTRKTIKKKTNMEDSCCLCYLAYVLLLSTVYILAFTDTKLAFLVFSD